MKLDNQISDIIDKSIINDIIVKSIINDTPEQFIQSILDKMFVMNCFKNPDDLLYKVDRITYFSENENFNTLWCRNSNFWEILENKYSLKYTEIQNIVKNMVENHFKCKIGVVTKAHI